MTDGKIIQGEEEEEEDEEEEVVEFDVEEEKKDCKVSIMKSELDKTVEKLNEVIENQKHLMENAQTHFKNLSSDELGTVDETLSKLPEYLDKIQRMQLFMATLPPKLQKMTKRTRDLQIEAQSRALAREDEKDQKQQWNALYAVKPAPDMRHLDNS